MTSDNFPIQVWMTDQNLIVFSALFSIVLIVLINWKKIRRVWLEWRTRRCLDAIGIRQQRNVVCSDGLDGEYVLDRLVMLPKAILLITLKPYSGNIYCADRISEWTQVIAQKSYKFENPLFELENQLTALRNQVPNILFRGLLFFDHNAHFPKGHPDTILHPGNIPEEYLRENCAEPDQAILDAWEMLLALPVESASNRQLRLKT
jgi:hypothetical protein